MLIFMERKFSFCTYHFTKVNIHKAYIRYFSGGYCIHLKNKYCIYSTETGCITTFACTILQTL